MARGAARGARRRVRGAPPVMARGRSAEDWWWDRLAPSGSGYHLLQADSMLLVLPGPGPARARTHRRAARRAQRLRPPGTCAVAAKAKPRPAPAPEAPQGPDAGWGDRIPLEILLQIFGLLVATDGPMPFLGRAARVCRRWHEAASQPALWHTVTLSPPLAGRPALGEAKAEKKLLASLEWLMPTRVGRTPTEGAVWEHFAALLLLSAQVLTAPEADPHPLEVPGTPRVEGESSRLPCLPAVTLSGCPGLPGSGSGTLEPTAAPWGCLPGSPFLLSPPAGRCQRWEHLSGPGMGRKEVIAEAVKWGWHEPLVSFLYGPQPALPQFWLTLCLPQLVSESCPRLTFLKLSDCHGVTPDTLIMLAKSCPQLHSLDIQHSMVESTAVVSFLEEAGPRMQKLWLTYSSQTTAILGALLGSCCPQLQVLEVSTGINRNSTPLQLPVEALQQGCPQLQVLRLLNLMWLPKPSGRVVTPGPGFPGLEELCLASSTCNFVSNEVLGRLLHGSPNLRLLDLRGCARITPAGLRDLPCQELEQLHLGLYGMSDRLTLVKEGSALLTQKWCHTLRELDLSGQGFSEKDLDHALAAFSGIPGGSRPALCSLNLRGTRVTPSTVSSVISSCPGLLYLNLESCRCLPRGLKRAYRGPEEVQWCLEQLLTSLPSLS
nr:F-box/LRR-repeat protein 6 isoform X1 [Equus caballus]